MESDSILNSIKEALSIPAEVTDFDPTLILHVNSTFAYLWDLGLGPEAGFEIKDDSTLWSEYIMSPLFNDARNLMIMKIRLTFDPPQTGAVIEALKNQIAETEWRLCERKEDNPWQQLSLF